MAANSSTTTLAIPFHSFALPESMHDGIAANGLKKLILENVMNFNQYKQQLELCRSPSIPPLAATIDTLVLSEFFLGFPSSFLPALGDQLADLKNLTIARQRFAGMSMDTAREAEQFITRIRDLVELHMVDVFLPQGFLSVLGEHQRRKPAKEGLLILQIDYTYEEIPNSGGDVLNDTLGRMSIPELHTFISPGISWISFKMLPRDANGIVPYWRHATEPLVSALTNDATAPTMMKHLKITAFQLSLEDLRRILAKHPRIMNLDVTLRLETMARYLERVVEVLGLCSNLCQIEIVGFPVVSTVRNPDEDPNPRPLFTSVEQVQALTMRCPNLFRLNTNVLLCDKFGAATWSREPGRPEAPWEGGVTSLPVAAA